MIHKTKDGKEMLLSEMSVQHIENTIKLIKSKAKEGMKVSFGIMSQHGEPDFYEELVKGKEVEDYFNLEEYKKELERRRK